MRHVPMVCRIVIIAVLAIPALGAMEPLAAQTTPDQDGGFFDTWGAEPRPLPDNVEEMVVERVTDGDTLRLTYPDDDWYYNVRIIGIDTPEKDGPYTDAECYGTEASNELAKLLPVGTYVYVEVDADDEDNNGRWLRHVWLPFAEDGVDVEDEAYLVSEILVLGGFADAREYPPNDKYDDILAEAEEQATESDAGFWGAC